MTNWLSRWWRGPDPEDARARLAALERECGELRREVAESAFLMKQWQEEVKSVRAAFGGHIDDAVSGRAAYLVGELAEPVARLGTLVAQAGGADAGAFMAWAAQFQLRLRRLGITPIGTPGERIPFDPAQHEPAGDGDHPVAGAAVVVVEAGVSFKGHAARKARVRPA